MGDEVFGISRGSFAEYAAARADKLVHKPAALTFEQAAVVPVSSLTALRAVIDVGRVQAGQRVLVIGASGGVGSYAVQLAKAAAPRSPASPAPRSSTSCGRSAQITSSTTRRTTGPTGRATT